MALNPDEIGRRLKSVREELGISIEAVAAACGIAPDVFSQIERGKLVLQR